MSVSPVVRDPALLFAKLTGTSFAIIPYKGSADTVEGILTGSVDFGVDGILRTD